MAMRQIDKGGSDNPMVSQILANCASWAKISDFDDYED
jgi:hypothetical protein